MSSGLSFWLGQAAVSVLFAALVAGVAPWAARICGIAPSSRGFWRSAWLLAALPVPLSIAVSPLLAPALSPVLPTLGPLHGYGVEWIAPAGEAAAAATSASWPTRLLWMLYCTAVALALSRLAIDAWRLRRITARARPLSDAMLLHSGLADLRTTQAALQSQAIALRVTDTGFGPYASSGRRRCIVLPARLLPRLDTTQWHLVLRHELAHLRHHDAAWAWSMRITNALLWFNPLLRSLARRVQLAAELACDADALGTQNDMRRAYAEAYLETLRMSVARTLPCPATAFPPQDQGSHRMRITHIVEGDTRARKRPWQAGALALLALASGTALVAVQAATPAPVFAGPIIDGRVSSQFATTRPAIGRDPHRGVDLAAARGTPVHAAAAGTVTVATEHYAPQPDYGTLVMIDHGDGWQSVYAHLDSLAVAVGERVAAGQSLGGLGTTGRATGPHVHVEVLRHGERIDPASVIPVLVRAR